MEREIRKIIIRNRTYLKKENHEKGTLEKDSSEQDNQKN